MYGYKVKWLGLHNVKLPTIILNLHVEIKSNVYLSLTRLLN